MGLCREQGGIIVSIDFRCMHINGRVFAKLQIALIEKLKKAELY
jgi:hypothetical protein